VVEQARRDSQQSRVLWPGGGASTFGNGGCTVEVVIAALKHVVLFLVVFSALGGALACQSTSDDDSTDDELTEATGASLYRPGNRFFGWGGEHDRYLDEVQPIFGKRCVTCHGCSQSPCQLKLTSFEGAMRGATKANLFAKSVLPISTGPTRLKDGVTEQDWRRKGFFSVTQGGKDSIMGRLLEHGAKYDKDGFDLAPASRIYDRQGEEFIFTCVESKQELDERLSSPGTGMPFGFTGLVASEYETLAAWLADGAPGPSEEAKRTLETPRDEAVVKAWEDFFNQDSPKARLSMRYIFEHVFFGKIHFDESQNGKGDYFELVRATSRTGPIKEIVTERPNDNPGAPFSYRLKKHTQLVTAKDFTVFHLTDAIRARWEQQFLRSEWDPGTLPDYSSDNPFKYFEQIPGTIRYRFMLENAQRLNDAMVKGDVCTGGAASYAIRDRYFQIFLKPESDPSAIDPKLGQKTWLHLEPSSSSLFRDVDFERLFERAIRDLHPQGLSVDDIWDGDKKDKNAWVTMLRHGKNASAHYGPTGQLPETMWVISYANFERLYYDLVVLYRPWGALPHKLGTWTTMSHVRADGEDTFLLFMPEAQRDALRKEFTPGWARFTEVSMRGDGYPSGTPDLDPEHPIADFVGRVRKHLGEAIVGTDVLNPDPLRALALAANDTRTPPTDLEAALYTLTIDRGNMSDEMPELTWLSVEGAGEPRLYSLVVNRMYWSNSRIVGNFLPALNRRPEEDSFSVVRGEVGSFPELFLRVPAGDVPGFVAAARGSAEDRLRIFAKYQVRRNTADFWTFLDAAHGRALKQDPIGAGIFDTSGYAWPMKLQPGSR
jgi:hypothetical protein